ncbi:hypothetical protein TrRE_jg9811 [Triparma retinervis]|uniref:UBC core domain-containing protein n=1 Tax=Triparma retinervis TaxID=2557542 RepID=A0A9W7A0W1_9STRA|nr:hypothetical protein TrRE_jg9811 [Triparma retinervis]
MADVKEINNDPSPMYFARPSEDDMFLWHFTIRGPPKTDFDGGSISAYHPEHWQPAWGIRLILEALISFFPTPGEGAIGALDWKPEERKRLAGLSKEWCCSDCGRISDLLLPIPEGGIDVSQSTFKDEIKQLHMHSGMVTPEKPEGKKSPEKPAAVPALSDEISSSSELGEP